MLFNSFEFILGFLPAVFALYFLLGRLGWRRLAVWALGGASVFFYGWWDWSLVWLLMASVGANYALGLALAGRPSRPVLIAGVAFNLGLLGWFKYANFFAGTVNAVAGTSFDFGAIMLPLAISFFTFQQIAYLVDVFHGAVRERDFGCYLLFVTFFPQLIAGPIVHHGEVLPQFGRPAAFRPRAQNISVGLTIFAIGLIKKVGLADPMGAYADRVYEWAAAGEPVSAVTAWFGTLAFGLEIYFDFSGYSDMAIGLARLFGIRLPLNFNSPYKAVNAIEFWRRWHMTLSRFLRDYLYFPLGGNRKGTVRRYANLMIVMLLGGLWHGAGWTFVVWGGLHGLFLAVNHGWHALRRALGWPAGPGTAVGRAVARTLTLLAVMFAWTFFRAPSWEGALVMAQGLAGMAGVFLPESYAAKAGALAPLLDAAGVRFAVGADATVYPTLAQAMAVAALLAFVLVAPNTQEWMGRVRPALRFRARGRSALLRRLQWAPNPLTGASVAAVGVVALGLLLRNEYKAFIYFQF